MDPREFQFVFFGLLAAWLIILVYVVSIAMRERRLRQELDRVRRMVEGGKEGGL
jgi:CcmD family protein